MVGRLLLGARARACACACARLGNKGRSHCDYRVRPGQFPHHLFALFYLVNLLNFAVDAVLQRAEGKKEERVHRIRSLINSSYMTAGFFSPLISPLVTFTN